MKKGVSLPINMIIIMIIAVLALLVILAFFMPGWFKQTGTIDVETAFTKGCNSLSILHNCDPDTVEDIIIPGFDHDRNGEPDSLYEVCQLKAAISTHEDCAHLCPQCKPLNMTR
ncbi:MAG: hypothetical protein J7K31_02385 [Candidatus Aenigmarchaeota archaeon]|nr:hypothetical protein [Candidatus Aenigmarchaeota archaeon]